MTKLEKLYSIIENSREVGVKLSKDVLQQVEELNAQGDSPPVHLEEEESEETTWMFLPIIYITLSF